MSNGRNTGVQVAMNECDVCKMCNNIARGRRECIKQILTKIIINQLILIILENSM